MSRSTNGLTGYATFLWQCICLTLANITQDVMENIKKEDIKQEVFDLYDDYALKRVNRRDCGRWLFPEW